MKRAHRLLIPLLLLTALLAATLYNYRGYLAPFIPANNAVASTLNEVSVPPGFSISSYAENIPGARSMTVSPSGVLYVGSRGAGRVYAVFDDDNDYQADKVVTILEGLNSPNGVAFYQGALYVAEINRILRYNNIEQHLPEMPPAEVIHDGYPTDTHHGWKFIAFGPDGKLYVPVGAPCNICRPDNPIYATITRMNPDGSGREIFARGVRNSVGFDWHPETGELWFTDNGRDWLGDNRPPDELNHAPVKGMHFGYPYCHGTAISDPEFGSQRSCDEFRAPAQELGPHVASLGMRFYNAEQFPAEYRGGIFIAEHGSWNRKVPIGYRVMFVKLRDDSPISYTPFAEGWLREGDVLGRPVDIQLLPDGSMLVSDDKAGRIYRITYEGEK